MKATTENQDKKKCLPHVSKDLEGQTITSYTSKGQPDIPSEYLTESQRQT
jgi:hypothetical protein